MAKDKTLEVFQDLEIDGPESKRNDLRAALIAHASGPWKHSEEHERDQKEMAGEGEDILVFLREPSDDIAEVALFLWRSGNAYKVTNIVPREFGSLGRRRYNALLQDFIEKVAKPAAKKVGLSLSVSDSGEKLEDWVSEDVARALRAFSGAANKSTGSSHPSDRKRWLDFLILVHSNRGSLDTDLLFRWLVEVADWPEDVAEDLVLQYEFGLDLLDHEHQSNK